VVKLILVFVVPFVIGQDVLFPVSIDNAVYGTVTKIQSGVITMEDILLINLHDPNDKIDVVIIRNSVGEILQEEDGCGGSNCSYNVDALKAGTYDVTVIPLEGNGFTGTIILD